jgi:uncharacterized protein YkwD
MLSPMRTALRLGLPLAALLAATTAHALTLNEFRRAHKRPPLVYSGALSAAAQSHAYDMARRNHLDHNGFFQRMSALSSVAAENVSYGCATQDCAIRQWARSPGHRRNMLMRGISRYGIAYARGANGRVYWVLELGN